MVLLGLWFFYLVSAELGIFSSVDKEPLKYLTTILPAQLSLATNHPASFKSFYLHFDTNTISYIPSRIPSKLVIHYDHDSNPYYVSAIYKNAAASNDIPLEHRYQIDVPRPTLSPLPAMAADGKVQQPSDQSFIGRYWYYIIPIVVIALSAGGGDEATAPPAT